MDTQKNRKPLIIGGISLIVLAGGGFALAGLFKAEPQDQLAIAIPKDATMEERVAAMDKLRDQMRDEKLTDEQRRKLGESMRATWEGEMQKRVNEYFNADPAERDAILDKHIDEMEQWRKMMDERREKEEQAAEEEGKTEEEIEKEREKEREKWRDRMKSRSREERKKDSETRDPNEQAQRMAYFSAMRKQMEKRGIQAPMGPGGRGPGGGGRGGRG
ncbi:hypothetical protein B7486_17770 [cyanobacterium TDX16]|nr:hypothetical protein B7486_17770 [cyanobacterium TDX16]